MLKVYFNGSEQNVDDVIDVNEKIELTIIREDGYNSTEQILREKTESQLSFTGNAYKYLCDDRKNGFCNETQIDIYDFCDDGGANKVFNGIIKQQDLDFEISKCIVKAGAIKDNSFSGKIRDYTNVDVDISNRKTQGCYDIQVDNIFIETPTIPTYTLSEIKAYDVLDVFKFLINYFTDNTINVVSTYLTNNKYAITTGFNLHNNNSNNAKAFPSVSIDTLFNELRKKLNIYMGIEYDSSGSPYLRIEDEPYFFANTELFSMSELPFDASEKIDSDRYFSIINVGSTNTDLQDEATPLPSMPQNKLVGWNEETKTGCGACSNDKTKELDLVSDFIIDGNLVHEGMSQGFYTDYANDDIIYLLNYYDDLGTYRLVGNNTSIYNIDLNNENTLNRWVGIANSCIRTLNEDKYSFYIEEKINTEELNNNFLTIFEASGYTCGSKKKGFVDIQPNFFDTSNTLHTTTSPVPPVGTCQEANGIGYHYFEAQEDGIYKFKSELNSIYQSLYPTQTQHAYNTTFELHILIYADNTFTTQLFDYYDTKFVVDPVTTPASLEIETPDINMVTGNIAFVYLKAYTLINYPFDDFLFEYQKINFQSIPTNCTTITDYGDNFKPYLLSFTYPLCASDYESIRQNMNGYIGIKNNKYWIKELKYNPKKLSSFTLISQNTLCNC